MLYKLFQFAMLIPLSFFIGSIIQILFFPFIDRSIYEFFNIPLVLPTSFSNIGMEVWLPIFAAFLTGYTLLFDFKHDKYFIPGLGAFTLVLMSVINVEVYYQKSQVIEDTISTFMAPVAISTVIGMLY